MENKSDLIRKYWKSLIIAKFLNNYHSGQYSRGYRILSHLMIRFDKLGIKPLDTFLPAGKCFKLYKYLVFKYGDKV